MYEIPIHLIGNIATDPESQATPSGTVTVSFRLACTPRRFDRTSGQWVDGTTSFFTVKAWGALAQNFTSSVVKGDRVIVIGTVRTEAWTTGENEPRSRQVIVADELGPSTRYATAKPVKVTGPADEAEEPAA
jgi:single-strand DNA-binding protein